MYRNGDRVQRSPVSNSDGNHRSQFCGSEGCEGGWSVLAGVVVDMRPSTGSVVVSSTGQWPGRVRVHRHADDVCIGVGSSGGAVLVDDRQIGVQRLVLDCIRRGEGDQVVAARGAANVRRH